MRKPTDSLPITSAIGSVKSKSYMLFLLLSTKPTSHTPKFFRKYKHPSEGKLVIPDTGIKINKKSLPIRNHQPKLGEHNRKILQELGYTGKEIKSILK